MRTQDISSLAFSLGNLQVMYRVTSSKQEENEGLSSITRKKAMAHVRERMAAFGTSKNVKMTVRNVILSTFSCSLYLMNKNG